MTKSSRALRMLPPLVVAQMRQLGAHLAIARKRRRESRRVWAQRIGVSEPTLARMERGDPSVAFGVYATALWLVGRAHALSVLADPQHDQAALEQEVRAAQSRSRRAPSSPPASVQGKKVGG